MTPEERIDVLRTVAAFADRTPDELARIADGLDELSVAPGTVLAREEGLANGQSFVIVSGEAVLTCAGSRRGTVGSGALVADVAALGTTGHATVTAVTLMHLLVLPDRLSLG